MNTKKNNIQLTEKEKEYLKRMEEFIITGGNCGGNNSTCSCPQ